MKWQRTWRWNEVCQWKLLQSSLEHFQKPLPFREIYVKYLGKNSIQVYFIAIWIGFPTFCKIKSLRYTFDSLVNIRLLIKSIKKLVNISIRENEFLRNVWFSVNIFNQIRIQTLVEISANFHNDWRWLASVLVHLFQLAGHACGITEEGHFSVDLDNLKMEPP